MTFGRALHVEWILKGKGIFDHVNEIWEAIKSSVAPEKPHENSKNSTCSFELSVNETFGEVDPDVTKIHQITND